MPQRQLSGGRYPPRCSALRDRRQCNAFSRVFAEDHAAVVRHIQPPGRVRVRYIRSVLNILSSGQQEESDTRCQAYFSHTPVIRLTLSRGKNERNSADIEICWGRTARCGHTTVAAVDIIDKRTAERNGPNVGRVRHIKHSMPCVKPRQQIKNILGFND